MIHIKERKDMEDAFKKAQKPWVKLLQKVDKAKSDYHTACKTEKSATNQERNASGDSSISADQVRYNFIMTIKKKLNFKMTYIIILPLFINAKKSVLVSTDSLYMNAFNSIDPIPLITLLLIYKYDQQLMCFIYSSKG